jgi:hypothetical protein
MPTHTRGLGNDLHDQGIGYYALPPRSSRWKAKQACPGPFQHVLVLPSVLGRAGVSRILEPDMSEEELQGLKRSADRLRDALERIGV